MKNYLKPNMEITKIAPETVIAAAGAVVVKDVPENAIVAGVPAKIIAYKDQNNLNLQG